MHKLAARVIVLALLLLGFAPLQSGLAQYTDGRWALGFHGGVNSWYNDLNNRVIGPGGEIMLRFGMSKAFSAGILAGYEELKSTQDPTTSDIPYSYLKLHAVPASLVGWIHFAPGSPVNPFLYAGVGAMFYQRLTSGSTYVPDSKIRTSFVVPAGIGLEIFTSNNVSFVADAGVRLTDDYPDAFKDGKLDGYATAKIGFNFYLGTSATEREEQARAELQRIKDSTDAAMQHAKEIADAKAAALKAQAEALAQHIKDSTAAALRQQEELAARRLADTVMVLQKGKNVVLKGVNFETNKARLSKESDTILTKAYNALRTNPELKVLIVGYTDNVGKPSYNNKLSLRRAQAVKTWLVKKGIATQRLTVAGKGEESPVDDNSTPEGRANNRRIEFHVLK